MKFSDTPSNNEAKARLRALADSGSLPHALLLEGPPGVGKFAAARALAQYLHCQRRTPGGEPCGGCPSCLQHQTFNHVDTIFSFPVLKSVRDSGLSDDYLDLFRKYLEANPLMDFGAWQKALGKPDGQPVHYVQESQEIIRKLGFRAHAGGLKIVLLWLPERMRDDSANKLLKLVEEPPQGVLLLMTSDRPRDILPTIYSRLQRVPFQRVPDAEVASWLMGQKKGLDSAAAQEAATVAQGDLVRALAQVSQQGRPGQMLEAFKELMRLAYQRKVADLRRWAYDMAALGRDHIMRFLDYGLRQLRENFIRNTGVQALSAQNGAEALFSERFAPFINERNILGLTAQLETARRDISLNGNAKMVLFDMAVKTTILIHQ